MAGRQSRTEAVDRLLRERADRGVFSSFTSGRARGRLECSLKWLKGRPLRIVFDPKGGKLEFRDLLPNVSLRSGLYKDFRRFLKDRADPGLPVHRRVDPDRVVVRSTNRGGSVTLCVTSLDSDWDYLVSKGLKLVNEVFLGFLRGPYHEYMVANFQEPED